VSDATNITTEFGRAKKFVMCLQQDDVRRGQLRCVLCLFIFLPSSCDPFVCYASEYFLSGVL